MEISEKFAQMCGMYNKFVEGTKWINQRKSSGSLANQDISDFQKFVVEPMDSLYKQLDQNDQIAFYKFRVAAKMFDGTIEIIDQNKLNQKIDYYILRDKM